MVPQQTQTQTQTKTAIAEADAKFAAAINPSRDLSFFTIAAFLPLAIMSAALLFGITNKTLMRIITIGCGVISLVGFGRLMYETTLDIAGYPDSRLPVWVVLYLAIYLVSGFAFIFFGLGGTFTQKAIADALYISLSGYTGRPVETPSIRFLAMAQTLLSSFIHIVIITKFVNAF